MPLMGKTLHTTVVSEWETPRYIYDMCVEASHSSLISCSTSIIRGGEEAAKR